MIYAAPATQRRTTALSIPKFAELLKNGHWDISVYIDSDKWCIDHTNEFGVEMWLSFAGGVVVAKRQNISVSFNWFALGGCGFSYEEASKFDAPAVDPDNMGFIGNGVALVSESGGRTVSQYAIRKALNELNGFPEAVAEAINYKLHFERA